MDTTTTGQRYAVMLPGLGEGRYVVAGNTQPQQRATYDDKAEAERIAARCPAAYRAAVVPHNWRDALTPREVWLQDVAREL